MNYNAVASGFNLIHNSVLGGKKNCNLMNILYMAQPKKTGLC